MNECEEGGAALPPSFPSWQNGVLLSVEATFDKICIAYCLATEEVVVARRNFRDKIVNWVQERRARYISLSESIEALQETAQTADEVRLIRDIVMKRDAVFEELMSGPTEIFDAMKDEVARMLLKAKTHPCNTHPEVRDASTEPHIPHSGGPPVTSAAPLLPHGGSKTRKRRRDAGNKNNPMFRLPGSMQRCHLMRHMRPHGSLMCGTKNPLLHTPILSAMHKIKKVLGNEHNQTSSQLCPYPCLASVTRSEKLLRLTAQ